MLWFLPFMCTYSDTAGWSLSGEGRKKLLQNIQEIPASCIHARGWLLNVVNPLADSPLLWFTHIRFIKIACKERAKRKSFAILSKKSY